MNTQHHPDDREYFNRRLALADGLDTGPRIECLACKHDHMVSLHLGWIILSIANCNDPGCHCPGNPQGLGSNS